MFCVWAAPICRTIIWQGTHWFGDKNSRIYEFAFMFCVWAAPICRTVSFGNAHIGLETRIQEFTNLHSNTLRDIPFLQLWADECGRRTEVTQFNLASQQKKPGIVSMKVLPFNLVLRGRFLSFHADE